MKCQKKRMNCMWVMSIWPFKARSDVSKNMWKRFSCTSSAISNIIATTSLSSSHWNVPKYIVFKVVANIYMNVFILLFTILNCVLKETETNQSTAWTFFIALHISIHEKALTSFFNLLHFCTKSFWKVIITNKSFQNTLFVFLTQLRII